jgi:methylenetetrahydrofolate reductase (NADPH)
METKRKATMQSADGDTIHIEVLTPKQSEEDLDHGLERFVNKYTTVLGNGHIVSIPDNPMGTLRFQATEIVPELELDFRPDQVLLHVNTFHTRQHLDDILSTAIDVGAKHLLVVSGDGGERLPKLSPESIGMADCQVVTSVELLKYIDREYPGRFVCGVAYNPYEPQDHELEKMRRKIDAGATYAITQPILDNHDDVKPVSDLGIPVVIGAWMSKNLHLLYDCVGCEIPEGTAYDAVANLVQLRRRFPDHGLYLSMLGFKTQLPVLAKTLAAATV